MLFLRNSTLKARPACFLGLVALVGSSCLDFNFTTGRFDCGGKPCSPAPVAVCTCEPPSPRCEDDATLITAYPLGCDSTGACKFQQLNTPCAQGCSGDACVGEPCAGIVCNAPPPNTCTSTSNLASFAPTGTCTAGLCSYAPTAVSCAQGCNKGQCIGEACAGVTCTKPPPPECLNESTLRLYSSSGTCSVGLCTYAPADTTCAGGCADGACKGSACLGVTCNTPPSNTCADAATLAVYSAPGTCTAGACSYSTTPLLCAGGCESGACVGDLCAGVTCASAPAATCDDAFTLRTYAAAGVCVQGGCMYPSSAMSCAHGCGAGKCAPEPCTANSCTTPPSATCVGNARRTFAGSGTCTTQGCDYTPTDTPCAANEVCVTDKCLWNDASLATLTTSVSNLPFAATTTLYTVMVPVGTTAVTLTASLAVPARQSLKANGVTATSGTASLTVAPMMPAAFEVTSQSGAKRLYTVVVVVGWSQQAYVKAPNTDTNDHFGTSVAISATGNILAVGAPGEDGVLSNLFANTASSSGAVYVFLRTGTTWTLDGYIKPNQAAENLRFGSSVALSESGAHLLIGAPGDAQLSYGVNGNSIGLAPESGAAFLFTRLAPGTWASQVYFKASNTDTGDHFGQSVALSADGAMVAVGAPGESSGPGTLKDNNASPNSGAAYFFTKSMVSGWSEFARIKGSFALSNDAFGQSLSISRDGVFLAVGATGDDSAGTGISAAPGPLTASNSGAVYVFERVGGGFLQRAYVKASNTDANDRFGHSVALSYQGTTLAVGAPGEAAATTGINGTQANNTSTNRGAAYVFTRSGTTWSQQAYVKPSTTRADSFFGSSVAVSSDGSVLAVGAPGEASNSVGINGSQSTALLTKSGAAYVFFRTGTAWAQHAFIKASNTGAYDEFGHDVALSADGGTLAVMAVEEASNSTVINQDPSNNAAPGAGAAYVFTR